jgi:hypothetical protein
MKIRNTDGARKWHGRPARGWCEAPSEDRWRLMPLHTHETTGGTPVPLARPLFQTSFALGTARIWKSFWRSDYDI